MRTLLFHNRRRPMSSKVHHSNTLVPPKEPVSPPPFTVTGDQVASAWRTDLTSGLSMQEAARRLQQYGTNAIQQTESRTWWSVFVKQLTDVMVLVLVAAAAISFAMGEVLDGLTIVAIVVLNALLGFLQEYKAERSLDMLRKMASPRAKVRRNGRPQRLPATEVVPGDIIMLKEGDRIPADARLTVSQTFKVDESPLTGESDPATKDARFIGTAATQIADRRNMVYMGTTVVRGRGEAVVTATGMHTEIGDIAAMISGTRLGPTPLQQRLNQLGKALVVACLIVVGVVFALGVARGFGIMTMFLTGVSLAVAAVPEGLPAVVTIALALGVQRMIRRRAIVRTLPAVETLGCVTVICSDKTGTLTQNEMTVTRLMAGDYDIDVTGAGYVPFGQLVHRRTKQPLKTGRTTPLPVDVMTAMTVAARCNDAQLVKEGDTWRVAGDPTEGALRALAAKGGVDWEHEETRAPRISENPFDSDRKRMSVLVDEGHRSVLYVKGAPGVLLNLCSTRLREGRTEPFSAADRHRVTRNAADMADQALRVLAVAVKVLPDSRAFKNGASLDAAEKELTFVGLIGMMDSPRPEAAGAIGKARRAGIETVMVTGDHPKTAAAVGRHLGLPHDHVITGDSIDEMDDETLRHAIRVTRIFARVSPRHKLRIVKAFKAEGHVVAMTGDGVNDAPAVKEADVGIAMGITGTDVTREAAAVVLADDNYATIVSAVEEGRGIYDNVRKFVRYLLACNTGEVLAMLVATFFGFPLPLIPIQILWVNLVTDGLPAIALGVDPPDGDVMKRPPRHPKETVFAHNLLVKIAFRGTLIGLCTILAFLIGPFVSPGAVDPVAHARTLALSTLVCSQLVFVFQCRSEHKPLRWASFTGNRWLLVAVLVSITSHLAVVYAPPLQLVFRTVPLSATDGLVVAVFSFWSQLTEMAVRAFRRTVLRRFSMVRA